jgi:N-acetylmuramoyl-L-alanine amidase
MRLIDDDTLATMCVWAEARGESLAGKIAVAEVILRRTRKGYQSNGTMAGTIFKAKQFSWANESTAWRFSVFCLDSTSPQVKECREAWDYALGGSNLSKGAVLYYSDIIAPPRWASAPGVHEVAIHGRHHFFTDDASGV